MPIKGKDQNLSLSLASITREAIVLKWFCNMGLMALQYGLNDTAKEPILHSKGGLLQCTENQCIE